MKCSPCVLCSGRYFLLLRPANRPISFAKCASAQILTPPQPHVWPAGCSLYIFLWLFFFLNKFRSLAACLEFFLIWPNWLQRTASPQTLRPASHKECIIMLLRKTPSLYSFTVNKQGWCNASPVCTSRSHGGICYRRCGKIKPQQWLHVKEQTVWVHKRTYVASKKLWRIYC